MIEDRPPFIVRLAGALSIAFGAGAIVGMFASFMGGKLSFDFGFLGIPIGEGLLSGKRSSRSWALGVSGISLAVLAGLLTWGLFTGQLRNVTQEQLWPDGLGVALRVIASGTVFFGLLSATARDWFASDHPKGFDGGWSLPVMLVGAYFAAVSHTRDFATDAAMRRLFPVQTRLTFRDGSTGEPIYSIGHASKELSSSPDRGDLFAPRITTSITAGARGMVVELKGLSGRPLPITFTSEGYRPETFIVNDKSPMEATVNLARE